jgi:hypothetical protein
MMMVALKFSIPLPMSSSSTSLDGWYSNTKLSQNTGRTITNDRLLRNVAKIAGNLFMILSIYLV